MAHRCVQLICFTFKKLTADGKNVENSDILRSPFQEICEDLVNSGFSPLSALMD
jgi:hypothetical protein